MDYIFNNLPQEPSVKPLPINAALGQLLARNKWLHHADEILSHLENDMALSSSPITLTSLLQQAYKIIRQSEDRMQVLQTRIEHLENISKCDELTGILNRRGFLREFDRELDRVNRDKSQGGLLVMIDLDNFKTINDTYGHEAGDMALKLVSTTLHNDIRLMDVAGRMGGDEFVLLFVNTCKKQALERAQFLIKHMNNLSFIYEGHEIPVRASLGLKEYKKGSKAEHIFQCADKDMYTNKREKKKV